ncbi:hypothetical protein [Spirosoma montaniterrae]|uniref:Uncharacterized protein n=1 Tax=Spirosoma montaniterrae TaxID=1178516 RepID=A0A1P9WYR6_9BACT|nr:hypothetical protein [Spirosoma montaniterrae]AQG80526.1 hypothetical protein AWR27_15070 [Spirosoma montaniterrae]
MKPLNHAERTRRWSQFLGLYAALLLLITACCWLSVVLIPQLTTVQQHQTVQEMVTYRRQLTGTDKMLTSVEQGAPLTDNWLRNFFTTTTALDQQFPNVLFVVVTNSYRQLAGEYENARKNGNDDLKQLNAQKLQLDAKKAELLAALARTGDDIERVASAPAPPKPPAAAGGGAKPAAPVGPVINAGLFGPFKPLLISGSGEFGRNNPEVNASVQFMIVKEKQVMLAVYFETGGANAGTLAKVTDRREVYTAPPGYKIVGLSVPERTPWRVNYTDKTTAEDQIDTNDGLMTFRVQANTPGLDVGATGGSALSIQLKKPVSVKLEKE